MNVTGRRAAFLDVGDQCKMNMSFSESLISGRNVKNSSVIDKKALIYFDRGLQNGFIFRENIKLIVNNQDVSPKNLGHVHIEEFDNLDISPRLSLWGNAADKVRSAFAVSEIFNYRDDITDSASNAYSLTQGNMDDITAQIALKIKTNEFLASSSQNPKLTDAKMPIFRKIKLRITDEWLLYESNSKTVPIDSEEAEQVLANNEKYEYLTVGKGKNRRTNDSEAQTIDILYKSRTVNTDPIYREDVGTFVSNFEMFDTYANLNRKTEILDMPDSEDKLEVTTYSMGDALKEEMIIKHSDKFRLSSMVIERCLAGNIFRECQRRFRNMDKQDPLDLNIKYIYRVKELWSCKTVETIGKAISSFSWCLSNGDLLAVGYGIYDFTSFVDRKAGYICIWNIKNPVNPERKYRYDDPVTALAFSKETPQLLAIGLYNGNIEVVDIIDNVRTPVAQSERRTSPQVEPVCQIKWIKVGLNEELLTVSENGRIMKYAFTTGPFLLGLPQMQLDRTEGKIEGLNVAPRQGFLEADRHPQAFVLEMHPLKADVYFVGTDEGCLHMCSTFYPHQHTGTMRVHQGCISYMEFSPFSPKIFLTCGIDWTIRIWIDEIYEPVIELPCGFEPIRSAHWCPCHSTIIACTTKTSIQIWNIRKNISKPASIHTFGSSNIPLTICCFSLCGRILVVGDAEGTARVCALEDMPISPHFQYDELQAAIYRGLVTKPELLRQVKSLGSLGYEKSQKTLK